MTETLAKLDNLRPRTWLRANPIDVLGDTAPERFRGPVEALLAEPETDAVGFFPIGIHVLTNYAHSTDWAGSRIWLPLLAQDNVLTLKRRTGCR